MLYYNNVDVIVSSNMELTLKIHKYKSSSGRDLIVEYIDSLSYDEQIDGYTVIQNMENGNMDALTTYRWQDKIREVYFYKHNRIFYVIIHNDEIYLLHACRKQKNRTEKKDSKIIINRAKELGKELNIKFVR